MNESTTLEENTHYVYRQTSKNIMTKEEMTNEIMGLRMRVALLEEIIYDIMEEGNEGDQTTN